MAIADVVHQIHWPTLSLKHEMIVNINKLRCELPLAKAGEVY